MNPTLASTEMICWQSRDGKHGLECPPALWEQMRAAAVEGLNRVGHGGVEMGGVLYGAREGGAIRVLAARAVECEYASGPAFVLSGTDARAFRAALETPDPELAGLQAVGWYHSHTRSGADLTPADVEFHRAHFPKSWQAAIVLRPSNFGPTVAGIFFVTGAGAVQGDAEALEIRGRRARRAVKPPGVAAREDPGPPRSRKRRPAVPATGG